MKCTTCGFDNPEGMVYCGRCGAKMASGFYEGARKQITIFFTDIKGSTALTEKLDPEECRALLKPILDAMITSVHKFGGTVVKSAGDGIMALFGAPIAYEDHALRACYAGLLLQKTVKELPGGIAIRIGMNSGEVVVDVTESDLGKTYDALGPPVAIAARMEQTAAPNAVQIAPDTYVRVKDFVTVHSRGKIPIKGISEDMEVFELVDIKQEFTRFMQMRTSKLSTFTGRNEQMALLDQALLQALNGQGQVVGIVGEPGNGKSRLVYEFMGTAKAKEAQQYTAQGQTMFRSNPFFVLKQMVCALLHIDNTMSSEDRVKIVIQQESRYQNVILDILGLPINDPAWKDLSGEYKKQEIIKGAVALFLLESEKKPIIILIEDMQWVDNESLECINTLVERSAHAKILSLFTFRPEFKAQWTNKKYFTLIPLIPLSADSFHSLVSNILGTSPQIADLRELLVKHCNGNPFFLEETIRSLLDHKAIEGSYGEYRLLQPITHIVLPETIQSVLESRVDLLEPDPKKVLKFSSVIGKIISIPLLKYVVGLENIQLISHLNLLSEMNFISKIQEFPELLYSFNHDMVLETIYASLLKVQKKEMHALVFQCLEEYFPSLDQEQLIVKAGHALKGEKWDKAFAYYALLQIKAYDISAPVESVEYGKRMQVAFQNLTTPSQEQLQQYFQSILHMFNTSVWRLKYQEMIALVEEGKKVVKLLNDPIKEGQLLVLATMAHLGIGDYAAMLQCAEEAQIIVDEELKKSGAKNQDLQALVYWSKMHGYYYRGEYKKCIHFGTECQALLKSPFHRDPLSGSPLWAVCNAYIMNASDHLGELELSKKIEQNILELEKVRGISGECYIEASALAATYCNRGDYEQAMKWIDKSMELSTLMAITIFQSELCAMKGFILSLQNKPEEAKKYLDESYAISKEMNFCFKTCRGLNFLFEGYLNIKDQETAKAILATMFELGEKRHQKGIETMALGLKGRLDKPKIESIT